MQACTGKTLGQLNLNAQYTSVFFYVAGAVGITLVLSSQGDADDDLQPVLIC